MSVVSDELRVLHSICRFDIIAITETHLVPLEWLCWSTTMLQQLCRYVYGNLWQLFSLQKDKTIWSSLKQALDIFRITQIYQKEK